MCDYNDYKEIERTITDNDLSLLPFARDNRRRYRSIFLYRLLEHRFYNL